MRTTIAKRFTFDAAHWLPTVPVDHKCARMHGHTYEVELQFNGQTAPDGFCAGIDYADIADAWAKIHAVLDHRELNKIPGLGVPSTENLVQWILTAMFILTPGGISEYLAAVKVCESSTTWCLGHTPFDREMEDDVHKALHERGVL